MVTTRLANMPTSIRLLLMPTNHAGCMMYESGPGRRSFFGMNGLTCGRVLSSVFLCQLNVFQVYFIYRSHKCTCVCKFSMKREKESHRLCREESNCEMLVPSSCESGTDNVFTFLRVECVPAMQTVCMQALKILQGHRLSRQPACSLMHTHTGGAVQVSQTSRAVCQSQLPHKRERARNKCI